MLDANRRLHSLTLAGAGMGVLSVIAMLRESSHEKTGNRLTSIAMSRRELVFVLSRALALLLSCWGLVEASYIPERLFSLTHYLNERSAFADHDYRSSYYLVMTVFLFARSLALFYAAAWFWRCGPRVQALFDGHLDHQTDVQ